MKTNPLVELGRAGQSPWLDYIDRRLLAAGGLARLVAEDGVRGVTTNPTIFEKAISGGTDYDDVLDGARGKEIPAAYLDLVTRDVRQAADLLRPVHEATGGADGYVSLEVDPDLAYDAGGTTARAVELHAAVGRPNVMIKIPATREGLRSIEEATARGIPVNATLIFSVRRYEEVAGAYIRGVSRLAAGGGDPRTVASVASFFVSRVDTAVDAMLQNDVVARWPGSPKAEMALSLMGKVAVANARIAYARFREIFSQAPWPDLASKGARVQRPLWASTGTKNPKYSDIKYVEELVGPDTVNTMPPGTLAAFRDHGTVADRLGGAEEEAKAILADLGLTGIGIEDVCAKLEAEGVKSFAASFVALKEALAGRLSGASAG